MYTEAVTYMVIPALPRRARLVQLCLFGPLAFGLGWPSGRAQDLPTAKPLTLVEALQAALAQNTQIRLAHTGIDLADSRVLRESGLFDSIYTVTGQQLRQYQPLTDYQHDIALSAGIDTYKQNLDYSQLDAQGSRLFQSGLQLQSRLDLTRAEDNLENIGGVNRTDLHVQLNVPLLGGRGKQANTAGLRAARLELEGTVQEWNGAVADILFTTAQHYFDLLAAQSRLRIAHNAEDDARALRANVKDLIDGDKLPAVEIHSAEASVSQHHARSLVEEGAVIEAREALGQDIGLDAVDSQAIGLDEELPTADPASAPPGDPTTLRQLIAASIARRAEVQGAKKHEQAAETQRLAATEALRRRLDLAVSSGYSGLALGEGANDLGRSFGNRIGGANVQAGLTYRLNPARSAAHADLAAAQAGILRTRLAEDAAERRIGGEVVSANGALRLSRESLASATAAETALRQAYAGEQQRLQAAAAVLSDVLTAGDRVLDAQLAVVEARRSYAVALARLRLATGTLLGPDPAHPVIERATFYSEAGGQMP